MNDDRWFLVLPPSGAARTAAQHTAAAFTSLLGDDQCKTIDTAHYLEAYDKLLRTPDDTMSVDLFNQSFIVSCLDFKATRCLVFALAPITLFSLQLLRRYGVTTVLWFYEDYHKATYWKLVLPGYDHFFAIQHGSLEQECRNAQVAYHFLPAASACCAGDYADQERPDDVVFIGIPSVYRITVLEALARASVNLVIAGAQWNTYRGILEKFIVNTGWTDDAAAFALMKRAKIGINISFDNPATRDDVHISPRLFDIAAAGCIVVTEATPLLHESFPECLCHTFTSVENAVATVSALCAGYSSSRSEGLHNRTMTISRHRYIHRVTTMLRETGSLCFR